MRDNTAKKYISAVKIIAINIVIPNSLLNTIGVPTIINTHIANAIAQNNPFILASSLFHKL